MSLTSDLTSDYINKAIKVNLDIGEKTAVLDANPIIYIDKAERVLHAPNLLEKFLSVYNKALVSKRVIQKEVEVKGISLKLLYNMPNIDVIDLMDQNITCDTDGSSKTFTIPLDYDHYCYEAKFNAENGIISATYTSTPEEKENYKVSKYTPHTQKHLGDRDVIYLATTLDNLTSYAITEERDKENRRSLEDALKVNNIPYYSTIHILPTMVAKGLIDKKSMFEVANYLLSETNRSVSEELLSATLQKILKQVQDDKIIYTNL